MATFVLSDGSKVNNHGFRILLAGMNLERFTTNPVMLHQHDMERVIGRWENPRIEDNKLMADAVFDTEDPTGKDVARKVEQGFLKGCSCGLMVQEMQEIDGEWVATRSELFEASIVSVPSDAGAVVLYDENHQVLTAEALHLQFNHQLSTINNMDKIQELEAQLAEKNQRVAALEAQVENLTTENKKLQDEKVDAFLSAAVSAGKITEAEKPQFAVLAASDFATVEQLINAKKPAEKPHQSLAATMQHVVPATGTEDRSGWSLLDWSKKDPAGLKKLRAEQPQEWERLVNAN